MSKSKTFHPEALADWAENDAHAADPADTYSGTEAAEHGRALIAAALGLDAGQDGPLETFARAELTRITRGPGRQSLTAPGVQTRVRQVRLPDPLDETLARYVAQPHTTRSEVMREALEQYLETHRPA